jgi:hypothetical protein
MMSTTLWDFSRLVLQELDELGIKPPRIDEHDNGDQDGSDFIFGEITPELSLSEGEYMSIDQEQGLYSYTFGTKGCCGGDPTGGGESYFEPTAAKAKEVAFSFKEYFEL